MAAKGPSDMSQQLGLHKVLAAKARQPHLTSGNVTLEEHETGFRLTVVMPKNVGIERITLDFGVQLSQVLASDTSDISRLHNGVHLAQDIEALVRPFERVRDLHGLGHVLTEIRILVEAYLKVMGMAPAHPYRRG